MSNSLRDSGQVSSWHEVQEWHVLEQTDISNYMTLEHVTNGETPLKKGIPFLSFCMGLSLSKELTLFFMAYQLFFSFSFKQYFMLCCSY